MDFNKLDLLDKKVAVMQDELSQVLAEMQKSIQAMARMTQIALRTLDERLTALEVPEGKKPEVTVISPSGVEL